MSSLTQRLVSLFQSKLDRTSFEKEFSALSKEEKFVELASLWVPALYQHDAALFEQQFNNFLYIFPAHQVIISLLPRIEADGRDRLFNMVYRLQWLSSEAWNAEILALARSSMSDAEVLQAIQRRAPHHHGLDEETSLALYCRNPKQFRDFVLANLPYQWQKRRSGFQALRAATHEQGDEVFFWELFRRFASKEEWVKEFRQLLVKPVPADQLAAELEKIHPSHDCYREPALLRECIKRYGKAVMPYIEAHLHWAAYGQPERFLQTIAPFVNEDRYWRFFFMVGDSAMWNNMLRDLLAKVVDEESFFELFQQRLPKIIRHWRPWTLEGEVVLALYRRDPERYRPYLKQYIQGADLRLFQEAEAQEDAEFLDFLSLHFMRHLSGLIYRAYPPKSYWGHAQKEDQQAQREIQRVGEVVTARFDRIHAGSPEAYVRHAAYILSQLSGHGLWQVAREREYNPIFAYLTTQHVEAWQASPQAIQELLESPNIYVQIMALEMLGHGSVTAAQRVAENLKPLRSLLLSRARRNTKKKVLRCLEEAVRHCPALSEQILPLLEEAMEFRSKRAIDERIMVSFVRMRRELRDAS